MSRGAFFFLLPVVAGVAVGYTIAIREVGSPNLPKLPVPASPTLANSGANGSHPSNPNGQPRFVLKSSTFDFGILPPGVKSQHKFTFENQGDHKLELNKGKSSCFCTVAELPQTEFAPGESGEIVVEYTGQHNGLFSQHVTILTNDPHQPSVELSITGVIRPWVVSEPEQLSLGHISNQEEKTVEIHLFSFQDEMLALTKKEVADSKLSEQITLSEQPLPVDELNTRRAKSGVLVTAKLKSGLPWGRIQTKILLTTNSPEQAVVEIPLDALVEGDVTLVGKRWDAERHVLMLGSVNRREGLEAKLTIIVRGPLRATTKFHLSSHSPESLQAELSAAKSLGQETAPWQTVLTLRIPPGSAAENHLGGSQGTPGEIVLESNHPDAPRLLIKVRYSVEE